MLSNLRAQLKRVPGLRRAVRRYRAWLTPAGRALRKIEAEQPGILLQPSNHTAPDRHPRLFAAVRDMLGEVENPRLLSFGCSDGSEALTLTQYIPKASIDGIDVNPTCIERARRAAKEKGLEHISFTCAGAPPVDAEPYDAVFCLSVLRHGDLDAKQPSSCSQLLPFARFEAMVASLDRCVRPGGLLILWGCNFRFADTDVAKNYRVIAVPGAKAHDNAFYGRDDRLIEGAVYGDYIFAKLN